jgi:hypothetical protein
MPVTSPEFLMLEAIRDWMATLTTWQTWTGLSGDPLKARVVWPIKNAPALPVCVLGLMGGQTINLTGAAGGSNFVPSGSIGMWLYAADTDPDDEQAGYTTFGDLFFALISEMADKAHEAPVKFNQFITPEVPIVRSTWVATEDEMDAGLGLWWQGQVTVRWGVEE